MLGGFEDLHLVDVQSSADFIASFLAPANKDGPNEQLVVPNRACDCGAGIGRIAKHMLLKYFKEVDLVEQESKFLLQAQDEYLKEEVAQNRVGGFIAQGLQTFTPEPGRYDAIWCQWVLSHLTDRDLVAFLKRCRKGLAPNGMIFVKENTSTSDQAEFDPVDSSATRSDALFKKLFKKAGLRLVRQQQQTGFPPRIFPVEMYALKP